MVHKLILLSILSFSFIHFNAQEFDWAYSQVSSSSETPKNIGSDSNGNVFFASVFAGTMDVDPTAGVQNETSSFSDGLLQKFDNAGNFLWAKVIGGPSGDNIISVVVDNFDNVLITGTFKFTMDFDPGPGVFELTADGLSTDGFILKLDNNGDFIWAIQLGNSENSETINQVQIDSDNNIIAVGYFGNTLDFDPGPGTFELMSEVNSTDFFVWKLDQDANLIWAHKTGGVQDDYLVDVCIDSNDNIIATGYFSLFFDFDPGPGTTSITSSGGYDICVVKYNSAGDFQWVYHPETIVAGSISEDRGRGIVCDSNNEIILLATFRGTIDVDPTPGVVSLTSGGNQDPCIVKLDENGALIWARSFGAALNESADEIDINPSDKVRITGSFEGTVDFDPGVGISDLTSAGSVDCYVLALDGLGDFEWAHKIGSTGFDYCDEIHIDNAGSIYNFGKFNQTVDFDPTAGLFEITSFGSSNIFFRKLSEAVAGCPGDANGDGLVNVLDLVAVSSNFGCTGDCEGDANMDGSVNVLDLVSVSSAFGNVCE